jgi:hypothetical protein
MMRAICAVLGSFVLLAPAPADVDAVTFVTAFRAGTTDQYKNKQITGTGISFHGAIQERIADGSSRASLVITLGSDANGKLNLLKTWEAFVEAERARTTMVVALSGPALPQPPASGPTAYDFTGVYDGQVRTIMRAPQASDSYVPDPGPCPGEEAANHDKPGRFYCAPLLTGATATLKSSQ